MLISLGEDKFRSSQINIQKITLCSMIMWHQHRKFVGISNTCFSSEIFLTEPCLPNVFSNTIRHVRTLICSAPCRTLRAPAQGNSAGPETNPSRNLLHCVVPRTEKLLFDSRLHRRSTLRRGVSERHLAPGFDVPMLSPPLMCLTLGKIRLCSFSLVQLPKLQRQLERFIKVRRRKKKQHSCLLLIIKHSAFLRVSLPLTWRENLKCLLMVQNKYIYLSYSV